MVIKMGKFSSVGLILTAVFSTAQISENVKLPTVFISILVRNKAHTLPYFLSLLDKLNYPKDRITLYIKSHDNSDRSLEILQTWIQSLQQREEKYHSIIKEFEDCEAPCLMPGEESPVGWSDYKFSVMMNSRQRALNLARYHWADYLWNLDADVFLLDPDVLKDLINQNLIVVAPLLTSLGQYSNFWGEMNEDYYYKRSEDYSKILERKQVGCYEVPMVHSSQLIDLRYLSSDNIAFHPDKISDYPGPHDDIIVFALSCSLNGIPMYVCNQKDYGVIMLPLDDHQALEDDMEILRYTLLETTHRHPPIQVDSLFKNYLQEIPEKTKLGVDQIYLINLEKRFDRRERMEYNFDLLGINAKYTPAVDGNQLTEQYFKAHGIHMMDGFSEPYHDRPLKLGEIGCFMSHYQIWQDIVSSDYDLVLVLEDDIRFEPYFLDKFGAFLEELEDRREDWDLAFVGRKILQNAEEWYLEGSNSIVNVDYTHWTLAYILTQEGARKLIHADPLGKMIPVDEFIPIMYDRHPNETWSSQFPVRNLKAVSASPRLVFPTHYVGDDGYVSDTEDTHLISENQQVDHHVNTEDLHDDEEEQEHDDHLLTPQKGHCAATKDDKSKITEQLHCDGV